MDRAFPRIKAKLAELKQRDNGLRVFGATTHQYGLNRVIAENTLDSFERTHDIRLPEGYRDFLLTIGNGGAGPYYGLVPLEYSLSSDIDSLSRIPEISPSKPFRFTEAWNMEFDDSMDEEEYYEQKDEIYFDNKWADGLLRIANFGCGVSFNLVVSGPEYGHIWIDDRCNEQGIYPDPYFGNRDHIDFLNWYELWLDQSLQKLAHDSVGR